MINKIIDGIVSAIRTQFGKEYDIYTEEIKQGLREPCFLISLVTPRTSLFLGEKYHSENKFCVQYFPSSSEKRAECYSVYDDLTAILEHIAIDGDLVRGTNLKGEIVDDMLHFFVNYDLFTYRHKAPKDSMNDIAHDTDVKK